MGGAEWIRAGQLRMYVCSTGMLGLRCSSLACHRCILLSGGVCMYVHTYVHTEPLITSASVEAGWYIPT